MGAPRPDTRAHPHPSAILPSIWWVGRNAWGGHPPLTGKGDANIYLLKGAKFDVLIDSGGDWSADLDRNLQRAGSRHERIREIWLTHSHWDHSGGAFAWLRKRPRTRARISALALRFLKRGDPRLLGMGIHGQRAPAIPVKRIGPLREGTVLRCPPFRLRVEEMPGHAPDVLGFRGKVDGVEVLFSGDAAIGDQGPVWGNIGWLDSYWLSSLATYERSLARLAKRPPELLAPGHGVPHYGASARRSVRNCLRRVRQFAAFPNLRSMVPFVG